MIVENQCVNIDITKKNISIYKKKGYDDIKIGDTLKISYHELSHGSKTKVDVKCDYCGRIVKVCYRDYVRYKYDKYSCCNCRQRKTSEYNLKERQDSLYNRASEFCNEMQYELITPKSEILTAETRVLYKCPKQHICETKIYTLLSRHKCIHCSYEEQGVAQRKTCDEVYEVFQKYGGVLLNKEDYTGWNDKNLKVICNECGEIFLTSYGTFRHSKGQLCPKCASNISKGESKIKKYLANHDITFDMQYRFDNCRTKVPLPFDFYLQDYNICIEYDGEGHYKPIARGATEEEAQKELENIKTRDNIKTEYCFQNNIKLIRIPYWDFDNIENILDKSLFT